MTAAAADAPFEADFGATFDDFPIALGWARDGQRLAIGGSDGEIVVYDTNAGTKQIRWRAHRHGLNAFAWHPLEPLLASAGQDGCARLWRCGPDYAKLVSELEADTAWVEHVAWRGDGRQLACAAGRGVRVYTRDGELQAMLSYAGGTVSAVEWRPRGAQLAVAGYGGIEVRDTSSGDRSYRLGYAGSITGLAWSPDRQVIAASCQDDTVHFWRLRSRSDAMISGFDCQPRQLAWSMNSRWLATGGSTTVTLWPFDKRGPEGRAPTLLAFHEEPVTAMAFSRRAPWLATGCRGGALAVWRFGKFDEPVYHVSSNDRVDLVAWGARSGGALLASVSRAGQIEVQRAALRA